MVGSLLPRGRRLVLAPLAFVSLLLILANLPAGAADVAHAHDDHPDPGFAPSFAYFPGPDTVQDGLAKHADHPWVTLHEIGTSTDGRPLVLAEIKDPEASIPEEDRVVLFVFTQQHGNEPAGTPAALQLLDDITAGKGIAKTLDNQILLLLPMANPDGATANQRRNAMDLDINRDHITLDSPEAQALHKVLNDWDVHVALDHHEYGGIGFGHPVPLRLYDYDLTTLYPVHGNVRENVREAAKDLMYDGLWPKAEEDGYSANEYGEQTVAGEPVQQVAGGPDPGIMRNHLGLHHVAGILVETFIPDSVEGHSINPMQSAERRTAIHRTVMDAALEYVHEHPEKFLSAKRDALVADHEHPWESYEEGSRTGNLAAAYAAPAVNATDLLFAAHGLHEGFLMGDTIVHNLAGQPYAGHAAAILHPQSSRAVVDATATEPYVPQDETVGIEESPAPIGLFVIGILGMLMATLRRRNGS